MVRSELGLRHSGTTPKLHAATRTCTLYEYTRGICSFHQGNANIRGLMSFAASLHFLMHRHIILVCKLLGTTYGRHSEVLHQFERIASKQLSDHHSMFSDDSRMYSIRSRSAKVNSPRWPGGLLSILLSCCAHTNFCSQQGEISSSF